MKPLLLSLLVPLTMMAQQAVAPPTDGNISAAPILVGTIPSSLYVTSNGKKILEIKLDGTLILGEGVTPGEAAKEFATFLKQYFPQPKSEGLQQAEDQVVYSCAAVDAARQIVPTAKIPASFNVTQAECDEILKEKKIKRITK